MAATVLFDLDDIDTAFADLDARYLAGEAAAHAHTWTVVARTYAGFNRRELPTTTDDWVIVDHRHVTTIVADDHIASVRAWWELAPDLSIYIEAVHRLSDIGAVFTWAGHGTSHEGFAAEWRGINVLTAEGDLINRSEMFDEADTDAALARFEELSRPASRLENTASQVVGRFNAYFAQRDWDAVAEMLAEDIFDDDRRRVVNAGTLRGRDDVIADVSALADIGAKNVASEVIAIRGARLVLNRARYSGSDERPEAFYVDALDIVEIDADERFVAHVAFDLYDIDAAFAELDARYLAGEAAAHSRTWSAIASGYAALRRHEVPPTTPDFVNIDHRRGIAFEPGDMIQYIRATFDVAPDVNIHIVYVHRLSGGGAVVTHAAHGTSPEGFGAEWREIALLTVDGDVVNRCEMFDEADLDAALARFDELSRQAPRLQNAASRTYDRFNAYLAARDWDAMAEMMTDDVLNDDRRRVVNSGVLRGRDAQMADLRATVDLGVKNYESTVLATRGDRLVLARTRVSGGGGRAEAFGLEMLALIEIHTDNRIAAGITFDLDDIDAAFEELDARYLAGEAAAYADTWSLIAAAYATFNRRELPATTPEWINIDQRRGAAFAPGDVIPYIRAAWDIAPDISIYIEAVHRLSHLGAVVVYAAHGTSGEGFNAEWREVTLLTFEGELMSRCEVFDEVDLDHALARFDELNSPAPQLENAATRAWARIVDAYNRRDLDGLLAQTTTDGRREDRRKLLRASHQGPERRRAAEAWLRAPESWRIEIEPIAIRGNRLGLTRERSRDIGEADRPIVVETLTLTEVNDDELVHYTVIFDPDDINAAFGELTSRWIASGEVAHPEVIEAGNRLVEISNRHDWDALAEANADATYVNHRQLPAAGDTIADHMTSTRMMASLIPDVWVEVASVLTHSATGAVAQIVVKGTSSDGVAIEVPVVTLAVLNGERLTHVEIFDPDQRELALARFEELNRQA